jgi:hypothetical protein
VKGKHIGLIAGALVGFLWMWLGFGEMLFIALAAFVGWLVAGILEHEIDVQRFFDGLRRK